MDAIDSVLTSIISRIVAALTPVFAGVIAALLLWVQDVVGIDLQVDPAVAAAYVGTVVLGACLVGLKWLEGRAKFERAALGARVVYDTGNAAAVGALVDPDGGVEDFMGEDPVVPPGAEGREPLE